MGILRDQLVAPEDYGNTTSEDLAREGGLASGMLDLFSPFALEILKGDDPEAAIRLIRLGDRYGAPPDRNSESFLLASAGRNQESWATFEKAFNEAGELTDAFSLDPGGSEVGSKSYQTIALNLFDYDFGAYTIYSEKIRDNLRNYQRFVALTVLGGILTGDAATTFASQEFQALSPAKKFAAYHLMLGRYKRSQRSDEFWRLIQEHPEWLQWSQP